jgi:hypothetical protein
MIDRSMNAHSSTCGIAPNSFLRREFFYLMLRVVLRCVLVVICADPLVAHANDVAMPQTYRTPSTEGLLRPWEIEWRHALAWQAGNKTRANFAPPGCYKMRSATTADVTRLQRDYICR